MPLRPLALAAALAVGLLAAGNAVAQEVVNVYSARHYDTDDALYSKFTEQTGIEVNLIEGDSDALIERLQREGELSEADVFITVDAGRLHRGVEQDIFAPVKSATLSERIPENLRHPDGLWFGLTQRVRVLIVSRDRVPEEGEGAITTYEDLADPRLRGKVLVRGSNNIYNQSLVAAMIETQGEEKTKQWAEGLVANFARTPQGGDRDQIRAVAAGEGDVALSNHYYFARMLTAGDEADMEAASKVRLVFPNQEGHGDGRGAHVNVSGIGVTKNAPNRANAVKFIEYLTTPEAQEMLALANNEYPVIEGVELTDVLKTFGKFRVERVTADALGENNRAAVRLMDAAGWR